MVILYSSHDTQAESANPITVYGTHTTMNVANWASNIMISYVKFDLSSFASTVNSAKLYLYISSANNNSNTTLVFKRVMEIWAESVLNYNNKPTTTTSNQATKDIPLDDDGWIEIDVTSIINDMITTGFKYGIEITSNVIYSLTFYTKEQGSNYHPYLVLDNDHYVKVGGNDSLSGNSWANAWATVNKAATTVADGETVHIGFGDYVLEPAGNEIAPQNIGVLGIYYAPEQAPGGSATPIVSVEKN